MSKFNNPPKILILVLAINDIDALKETLSNIQSTLFSYEIEVVVILDVDNYEKIDFGALSEPQYEFLNIKALCNPENQGYGGNQKLGYCYAIMNDFDAVVLLHGDSKNASKSVEEMITPILNGSADAVIGSVMLRKEVAKKGFIPVFGYLYSRLLTPCINKILKSNLTDFYSGIRAYSVRVLKSLPFQLNTNDNYFDIQLIIQLLIGGFRIREIPLHPCYRNEVCSTNRLKYSWNLIIISILSKLHSHFIIYKREFDIEQDESHYDSKLDYLSSHSMAIDAVRDNSKVLDIGCNRGYIDKELKRKGCYIVGIDCLPINNKAIFNDFLRLNLNDVSKLPSMDKFDYILMLDIIEHLDNPELFLDKVREKSKLRQPTVIITTSNVAFFLIRLQLLFSQFNYGKVGILDLSHKRLFTFGSVKKICEIAGYKIKKISGIPFPFPKVLGKNKLSMVLLNLNRVLIFLSKKLFSYQIYIEIIPTPNAKELLKFIVTKDQYFISLSKTGVHTSKKT